MMTSNRNVGPASGTSQMMRLLKFCLVGGSGVFVDMGVFYLLVDPAMLGWNLTPGKVVAAEVAILNNFTWNDLWTFRDLASEQRGMSARFKRFVTFNGICLIGILLSVLLLNFQVRVLGFNPYLANLVSIVIVTAWNFLMNLKFSWGRTK